MEGPLSLWDNNIGSWRVSQVLIRFFKVILKYFWSIENDALSFYIHDRVHHECEKREHNFTILWDYLRIFQLLNSHEKNTDKAGFENEEITNAKSLSCFYSPSDLTPSQRKIPNRKFEFLIYIYIYIYMVPWKVRTFGGNVKNCEIHYKLSVFSWASCNVRMVGSYHRHCLTMYLIHLFYYENDVSH